MSEQPEVVNAYLDDDERTIVILERQADGRRTERRVRGEYVSWHRADQIGRARARQLKALNTVRSFALTADGFVRIAWTDKWTRRDGLEGMKRNEVESLEGDVDPVTLWLIESKARIARPRACYLDLETDSDVPLSRKEDMTVLSWAVTDRETGEERSGVLAADTPAAERALLLELVAVLRDYDQIIVWEGDWPGGEFDSFVLPARCQRRGIPFEKPKWLWLNMLAVWKRMNMQSAESGAEKESFKLEDIAHEQIGEGKEKPPAFVVERFPEKAAKGLGGMTRELWDEGGAFRDLLVRYNRRDATLLRKLELRKGYLVVFEALCKVCGIIPETRSLRPTRQMDGFVIRLGREQGHRFPTLVYDDAAEKEKKFRGAFVLPPKSVEVDPKESARKGLPPWSKDDARAWRTRHGFKNGIIRNLHVCDFKSLYPSVIRTWNLSADVVEGWSKGKDEIAPGTCRSPGTGLVTRNDHEGIIPRALGELLRLRKHWSDLAASLPPGSPEWADAKAISNAYKVAANSFYGAAGSKGSRFYNRDVSEATTLNSVHLIKQTIALAEKRAMSAAYGDTDSCAVVGPSEEAFRKFVDWMNTKHLPAEVAMHGCKDNHVKLAFEKTFDRVVFVASKNYVGRYLQFEGVRAKADSEPEVKGLAWKRGDRGRLTRELQGQVIDCLVGGLKIKQEDGTKLWINRDLGIETPTEDIDVYRGIIERARDHVMTGDLPLADVRVSKSLSKSLREYGKDANEAHVRVAKMMVERGQQAAKGMRIEYVVVDASKTPQVVIPAEDYTGELDRFYLWESVYSPTLSLLEAAFPDEDWVEYVAARPRKRSGKSSKVAEEQLGLGLAAPGRVPARAGTLDELAVPAYSARPLVVRVPEAAGAAALDRLRDVFAAYPGARAVEVVIELQSGQQAVVRSDARVSPGPGLLEAVRAAIAERPPEHVAGADPNA